MKFVMPSKRLLVVAVAGGILAALPMFVVLAAQGQITEVNPSGISSVQSIVSLGEPDDSKYLKNSSEGVLERDKRARTGKSCKGKFLFQCH